MPTQWDLELGFDIGDNICIKIGGTRKYYKVTNRDKIFYLDEHSAIAADSTETFAEITNLNPPHGQVYQIYKVMIDGNVKLYLKQPAATNRWGTQRSPQGGFLTDRLSGVLGGQPVPLFFTIDNPPSVQLVNEQPVSITPKIWWFGWRYAIEELIRAPVTFTEINISGLAQ